MKNDFVPNISIRGQNFPMISQTKLQGVLIDDQLHFSDHINKICRKVSRSIGVNKKLSAYLPQSSLITLYYSIVYPHLFYAIEVWGSSSKTQLNRLRRLLDECLEILCKSSHNGLEGDRIFFLLYQISKYFLLIRTFRYYTMNLGPYFRDKFQIRVTEHQYDTRFSINQILLLFYCCFFYNAIRFWNTIPVTAKFLNSVSKFKKCLMKQIFENP